MTSPNQAVGTPFNLEYPQSIGVFSSYEVAQKVVDYLSDQQFPVQNLCIVGTELKSVERVTGRRTWRTVLTRGAKSGITTGMMVALIMLIFGMGENFALLFLGALGIGVLIGIGMSALSYVASKGKRDFNSISQTIATRYEVMCEHKVFTKAKEIVAAMPEVRMAAFTPDAPRVYPYAPVYPTPVPTYPAPYPPAAYYAQQPQVPYYAPVPPPGYYASGNQPTYYPPTTNSGEEN